MIEVCRDLYTVEESGSKKKKFSARKAAFSCVLLMNFVLFSSGAFSQMQNCSGAVGQWEFSVFGQDCKGYEEEGNFVMTVDADCNMKIDILSSLPYAEQYLVTNKSLTVQNGRFHATVDFTVDQCSMLVLNGKVIGGKKIEGTYRYEDGGGGTFKAVKKKSGPSSSRSSGP